MGNTPIWTTKDKQWMPITEMSDSHLISAHRMMLGKVKSLTSAMNEDSVFSDSEIERIQRANVWVMHFEREMKNR